LAAARAAGLTTVFCAGEPGPTLDGLRRSRSGTSPMPWNGPNSELALGPKWTGLPRPSEQAKRLEMGL
jgi:hypothetical protein